MGADRKAWRQASAGRARGVRAVRLRHDGRMSTETLRIEPRFRGPPQSGNGGYTCGRVARFIEGPASVRLLAPPPLGKPLRVDVGDGIVRLYDADTQIAEARPAAPEVEVPALPVHDEAIAAARGYTGFQRHPFPGCFVCGPQRAAGDGLRVFAGPLGRDGIVASPWVPGADLGADGRVREEFIWAALDCPGAFAVMPQERELAIVLGQLEARIDAPLAAGTHCVVIGWPIASAGRKRIVGTAIADAGGRIVARARATWIVVPAAGFAAST